MQSRLKSSTIRSQVRFAPDPRKTAGPTQPRFVETRLVRDLTDLPERAKYIIFNDVVENVVVLTGSTVDSEQSLYSRSFNETTFLVAYSAEDAQKILEAAPRGLVPVHPSLEGRIWVITTSRSDYRDQAA